MLRLSLSMSIKHLSIQVKLGQQHDVLHVALGILLSIGIIPLTFSLTRVSLLKLKVGGPRPTATKCLKCERRTRHSTYVCFSCRTTKSLSKVKQGTLIGVVPMTYHMH